MVLWLYSADPVLAWIRARVRPAETRAELPEIKPAGISAAMMAADGRGIRSAEAYADFHRWAKEAGFRAEVLPAVNGFVQRFNANCDFVTVRHGKTGGRIYGCVIGEVRDEEEDEPPG
jgi:hypothetical protein